MKTSISITLTSGELDIITKDAKIHHRSLSSEIGYLIRHHEEDEKVHKIIFAELAGLKKQIQERL